jgi:hypothetical protein
MAARTTNLHRISTNLCESLTVSIVSLSISNAFPLKPDELNKLYELNKLRLSPPISIESLRISMSLYRISSLHEPKQLNKPNKLNKPHLSL